MAERKRMMSYDVFQSGLYIGRMVLTPEGVKKLERKGFTLKTVRSNKPKLKTRGTIRKASATKKNPGGLVKIYAKITRIEGTKGNDSLYPGQKFFHNFKRPYPAMYGTKDRKTLVIK